MQLRELLTESTLRHTPKRRAQRFGLIKKAIQKAVDRRLKVEWNQEASKETGGARPGGSTNTLKETKLEGMITN